MGKQLYKPPAVMLGPRHDGIKLQLKEFEAAELEDGFQFELIKGELEVSPSPGPLRKDIAVAIFRLLDDYRRGRHPAPFAAVVWEPRVFVDGASDNATIPQPDVAAYRRYPQQSPESYREGAPSLVVELVSRGSAEKDYIRNRRLYARVRSVLEYWIIDPTVDAEKPAMTVYVRPAAAKPMRRLDVRPGGRYSSGNWPELGVDLSRLSPSACLG